MGVNTSKRSITPCMDTSYNMGLAAELDRVVAGSSSTRHASKWCMVCRAFTPVRHRGRDASACSCTVCNNWFDVGNICSRKRVHASSTPTPTPTPTADAENVVDRDDDMSAAHEGAIRALVAKVADERRIRPTAAAAALQIALDEGARCASARGKRACKTAARPRGGGGSDSAALAAARGLYRALLGAAGAQAVAARVVAGWLDVDAEDVLVHKGVSTLSAVDVVDHALEVVAPQVLEVLPSLASPALGCARATAAARRLADLSASCDLAASLSDLSVVLLMAVHASTAKSSEPEVRVRAVMAAAFTCGLIRRNDVPRIYGVWNGVKAEVVKDEDCPR